MLFFDAHCDILSRIDTPEALFSNRFHWDAQRALSNGPFIQVFASFAGSRFRDQPEKVMESQLQKAIVAENQYPGRLKLIRTAKDLENALKDQSNSKVYGLLEAEGGEILGGSLEKLDRLYDMGLRVLTLAWNFDNELCDSVAGQSRHNGLSAFGREVVARAQELGMLIDVSHCSDKTLEDVLLITQKPITASHSNARALCSHPRNLTDDQIKALARSGGVIGINFYPLFLDNSGNAQFMDIIKHIEYISALVGPEHVGLGSDFDGFSGLPHGMNGVEELYKIPEALLRLNYTEAHVKAIAGENFTRLLMGVLKPA